MSKSARTPEITVPVWSFETLLFMTLGAILLAFTGGYVLGRVITRRPLTIIRPPHVFLPAPVHPFVPGRAAPRPHAHMVPPPYSPRSSNPRDVWPQSRMSLRDSLATNDATIRMPRQGRRHD